VAFSNRMFAKTRPPSPGGHRADRERPHTGGQCCAGRLEHPTPSSGRRHPGQWPARLVGGQRAIHFFAVVRQAEWALGRIS